jgi:pyrroloquinoline quinone biosynthesis protein B
VIVHVLGVAAGGGYPQWNCACATCRLARGGRARPLSHASVAFSATGRAWYLVNASPDVRQQVESCAALHPGPSTRSTPIAGVLLTDAELDHTLGLLVLREGTGLAVFATTPVLEALRTAFPVRRILDRYAPFDWRVLEPGVPLPLDDGALGVEAFRTGSRPPRYAMGEEGGDWAVGFRIEDRRTGGVAVYAPGVESWTPEVAAAAATADCVLFDGTFWCDDEMRRSGAGTRSAGAMGHLPIAGPAGSAERLARLPARHRLYVHVNNTNPVLDRASPERRALAALGLEVAADGMALEL